VKVFDVWADWCAPCKRFAPIFEKVAEDFRDIEFIKVNADTNPDFLNTYSINSIPTILLTDDSGNELIRHVGILSEANFKNLVSTLFLQTTK
jgi:thioredoxin 1